MNGRVLGIQQVDDHDLYDGSIGPLDGEVLIGVHIAANASTEIANYLGADELTCEDRVTFSPNAAVRVNPVLLCHSLCTNLLSHILLF